MPAASESYPRIFFSSFSENFHRFPRESGNNNASGIFPIKGKINFSGTPAATYPARRATRPREQAPPRPNISRCRQESPSFRNRLCLNRKNAAATFLSPSHPSIFPPSFPLLLSSFFTAGTPTVPFAERRRAFSPAAHLAAGSAFFAGFSEFLKAQPDHFRCGIRLFLSACQHA